MCVAVCFIYVGVGPRDQNLTVHTVFKVPEIPKKPEEKVSVPVPKKEKAPPAKGTALSEAISPCSVTYQASVIPALWWC